MQGDAERPLLHALHTRVHNRHRLAVVVGTHKQLRTKGRKYILGHNEVQVVPGQIIELLHYAFQRRVLDAVRRGHGHLKHNARQL